MRVPIDKVQLERLGEIAAGTLGPKVGIESALNAGRFRFPDKIDEVSRLLIETKNVAYQHLSTQLRDYIQIAQRDGYPVVLNVRARLPDGSCGTTLSSNLQELVNQGIVILNECI